MIYLATKLEHNKSDIYIIKTKSRDHISQATALCINSLASSYKAKSKTVQ